jgi:phosphate transport system substrate-binding protein
LQTAIREIGQTPVIAEVEVRMRSGVTTKSQEACSMKPTQQKPHFLIVMLIILAFALAACSAAATEPTPTPTVNLQTTLMVSGSGTTTAVLIGVKPAFETDVPGYKLDVLPGSGTGGGVRGVIEGVLDVAAMARPPNDDEVAQGVEYVEFGQSGVAIYTHPSVGITNLTAAQASAIFSGQATNWSEVGGSDAAIILYVRDEGESSTKVLRQFIFGDAPFHEAVQVLTSQSDMQIAVAETPGSVGFGSWPAAYAAGADVRPIALNGVAPGDSAYPCLVPMGIGYLSTRKADVQPLIDWLLSEQGQAALGELDVITAQ